jgi:hypothetical protein
MDKVQKPSNFIVKYCDMMIENWKKTAIAMERHSKCVPTAVSEHKTVEEPWK